MIRYINLNNKSIEIFDHICSLIKTFINEYRIKDDKVIRYTIKQKPQDGLNILSNEWNIYYKFRKLEPTVNNFNNLKNNSNENHEEHQLKRNPDTLVFLNQIGILLSEYVQQMNIKDLINDEFVYYVANHINIYPPTRNYRIFSDILDGMPYHIDSSKYTIIQQNLNGLVIEGQKINAGKKHAVMFQGKMKHKVNINYKERISLSTFIFELSSENAILEQEIERETFNTIKHGN